MTASTLVGGGVATVLHALRQLGAAPPTIDFSDSLATYGEAYVKNDEAAYAQQVRERLEKQLRRRAKELGFEVVPKSPSMPEHNPDPTTAA